MEHKRTRGGPVNRRVGRAQNASAKVGASLFRSRLSELPNGFRNDIGHLWSQLIGSPIRACVAFISFVVSLDSLFELIFGGKEGGGSGRSVSILGPLTEQPSGRLLVFVIAACSIGWTLALITAPLSRSREDALRLFGFVLSGLCGLFLTFFGQHLLLAAGSGYGRDPMLSNGIAFLLTVAGIATATALVKKGYQLTLEADAAVIDRRAALLLAFTLCAIASAIIVFPAAR